MTLASHPLAAVRAERGLTQGQLSSLADVSTSAIARIESGARIVHGHTAWKVADALELPLDAITNPGQMLAADALAERTITARYLGISPLEVDALREELAKGAAA